MSLAFDTSILIGIEKKDKKTIDKIKGLSKSYPLTPQLPFISHFEYLFGLKKRKPKKFNELLSVLRKFPLLQITEKTSDILSDLKLKYDRQGISLSLADLLIASQVIENNLILATLDKDFEKIEEMKCVIL
ncbi:MAG TPA: type II toxin-antitoxin system VapC family toxin [Candidatus Pacearchaeota archaeon]|nr:PIN domain protein [archaeon BMS3Abin17]HDK42853.1 type II toxin-antitoxin system VapC family toxin [Candidatus Pacearchaeota archaeon]HDZ61121.1 type II toxin-antitoxin system VapC family toxin [Candidatus Pacearchaeota archaeon]